MIMEELTIGEVAEATGVPTSTLRYYEKLGIIPPPQRSSGQRRYYPEVLQLIAVIRLGKDVGFVHLNSVWEPYLSLH